MRYGGHEIDRPIIDLFLYDGFGLLLLRASGVLYTNQTGGYACLHPQEEGVFAPLPAEDKVVKQVQQSISEYFTGAKWKGCCWQGIDEETAGFLDSIFAQTETLSFLQVDRSRLQASHEAWIYVLVTEPAGEPELNLIAGFGDCRAVLTWSNSD